MKQVNLTITFDEEKLSALKRYAQSLYQPVRADC